MQRAVYRLRWRTGRKPALPGEPAVWECPQGLKPRFLAALSARLIPKLRDVPLRLIARRI
jgi:hypothetical protein